MSLQAYHVYLPASEGGTAPTPSVLDQVSKEVGGWPTYLKIGAGLIAGAAVAATAVVVAPVAAAVAVVEAGALAVTAVAGVGGVVGATGAALADYYVNKDGGERLIHISSRKELAKYSPFESRGSLSDGLYIGHPGRSSELLPSQHFHELIENEQIQEMLRYIRSHVKATSIKIARRRLSGVDATGSATVKGTNFEFGVGSAGSLDTLVDLRYEEPVLQSERVFYWRHIYQELVDGLHGVSGRGKARYVLRKVGGFSLNVGLAKIVGVNLGYLNERFFEVELDYI